MAGGTVVTITGSGFLGATGVTFGGSAGIGFTVVNDTTITVTTPPHAAGIVSAVIADPAGDASLPFEFVDVASVATSLTPTVGSEAGGTAVTITGSGFLGATGVTFDGTEGDDFEVVDDTTITVTSPLHLPATVDVVVEDASGDSDPLDFEYIAVDANATSLSPTQGDEAGGDVITITGSGFLGATGVEFNGTAGTSFTVVNDTTITVTSPPHGPGLVSVVVIDPSNNSIGLPFRYVSVASTATSLLPISGTEAGNTLVTITGTGFLGATGVTFGGTPGTAFTVVDDTTITVTTPTHSTGTVDVIVVDPTGNSAPIDFEYVNVASVANSLIPTSGTQAGGTPVTISGSGFYGATGVLFDGIAGTSFTVVNDTTITVTTPQHGVGPANVIVVDPAGNSLPLIYSYLAVGADATSLTPPTGTVYGGTVVTITGSGFLGATGVTFDGIAGTTFTVLSDTSIRVTTPAHTVGPVDVIVLDAAGNSDALEFTFTGVPSSASSLTPAFGPDSGGTPVTITGTGFVGATGVTFDGTAGTAFTVVNDTTITVTTPGHAVGSVDVVVVDPAGNSTPVQFEFRGVASGATSLAPSTGSEAGGTVITIDGTGFTGATGVTFDGTPGTNFTVVNDTTITVTSPAHDRGPVDVIVVDPAGNSTAIPFGYVGVASDAASIAPTSGSTAGGTVVTITGEGFLSATGVEFDGTEGTAFTIVNDTTIRVTSPAHALGTVDLVVLDPDGDSDPLDYTYYPPTAIDTVAPATGPAAGGTVVTISGTCFAGATAVRFGDTEVTDFTVNSAGTVITVTSPVGSGVVDVTVVGAVGCGTATDDSGFEFIAAPSDVTSITPVTDFVAGGALVTITGNGLLGATAVTFDGTPGTAFTVVSDSSITVRTPAHAIGVVDLVVVDPAGNSDPVNFTYVGTVIRDASPGTGPSTGGTTITITGECFTGATDVTFDGISAVSFQVNAAGTVITAVTPPNETGAAVIMVIGANECGMAQDPDEFEFVPDPSFLTSISPAVGPVAGGTQLIIKGSGFLGATGVVFGDDATASTAAASITAAGPAAITGTKGTSFRVVNATTILVKSPAHVAGTVDVQVLDPDGNTELGAYTFLQVTVQSLTPNSGSSNGGTTVTISGSCFAGTTKVLFGDTEARSFTVNDAGTVIRAVTPAGTDSSADVTIVGSASCGSLIMADAFQYAQLSTAELPATGVTPLLGFLASLFLLAFGALFLAMWLRHRRDDRGSGMTRSHN
ncbi:S-layer family protein [Glaciihabitans sp. dw_435]|uniref:beta strand repeat-containing protein n=1 Tax=Glaciihabitans sp. dw_435 TaxID=2720081 RepID=UPI001BD597E3|nr:IPT/TIG domain-containing protein [Glaciihabitans sp. dw_435]